VVKDLTKVFELSHLWYLFAFNRWIAKKLNGLSDAVTIWVCAAVNYGLNMNIL